MKLAKPSFLLTDLYQLAMMQAYHDAGQDGTAVFEFFVRKLPAERNFLMAAGVSLLRRRLRDAGGHGVLPRRADPA